MIFTLAANLAFFILAPLGSVSLVVGDWLVNAFIAAKLVENFVPNGPAIVGNVSAIIPVVYNIACSTMEPVFNVNYTGILQNTTANMNLTEWTDHMKEFILNSTTSPY